jgi:hypothetical protein
VCGGREVLVMGAVNGGDENEGVGLRVSYHKGNKT